jgi:hypothetical protein
VIASCYISDRSGKHLLIDTLLELTALQIGFHYTQSVSTYLQSKMIWGCGSPMWKRSVDRLQLAHSPVVLDDAVELRVQRRLLAIWCGGLKTSHLVQNLIAWAIVST